MKQHRRKTNNETGLFWRDACLAAAQVTFGIVAVSWFVPPFDFIKIGVLLFNTIATIIFVGNGLKISKNL